MEDPEENQGDLEQGLPMLRFQVFIPDNEYGIEEGYYQGNAIVKLPRENKINPDVIQFIADMPEE